VGILTKILIKHKLLPFILFIIMGYLFAIDKRAKTLEIIVLASLLGLVTYNLTVKNKLTALLTGLFGLPYLITIYKGKKPSFNTKNKEIIEIKPALVGVLAVLLASIIPTLSPSIAIFFIQKLFNIKGDLPFVYALGSLTTADVVISLANFYFNGSARNGAIVFVKNLLGKIDFNTFLLFLANTIVSIIIAFIATYVFAKHLIKYEIDVRKIKPILIGFIIIYLIAVSGFVGLLIALTAMFVGLEAIKNNINYSTLGVALMFPLAINILLS